MNVWPTNRVRRSGDAQRIRVTDGCRDVTRRDVASGISLDTRVPDWRQPLGSTTIVTSGVMPARTLIATL